MLFQSFLYPLNASKKARVIRPLVHRFDAVTEFYRDFRLSLKMKAGASA